MLDIEHPRRKAVAAQRKKKYDARRVKKTKAPKPNTDRISRKDVIDQTVRSSRVELERPQAMQEETKRDQDVETNNAGREDLMSEKENDSEEEESESESEEEDLVEEKREEEEVHINSRGRRINAPSRDTVPINQSSTYRRNSWT